MRNINRNGELAASVQEVLRYLGELGQEDVGAKRLDKLKAHKLLYLLQGWSLGMRGRPMFDARIEAYTRGPFVRGAAALVMDHQFVQYEPDRAATLSDEDKDFIAAIWYDYREMTGADLVHLSHKQDPWTEARGDLAPNESSSEEVTMDSMERYFGQQLPAITDSEILDSFIPLE